MHVPDRGSTLLENSNTYADFSIFGQNICPGGSMYFRINQKPDPQYSAWGASCKARSAFFLNSIMVIKPAYRVIYTKHGYDYSEAFKRKLK
jgi:hypothetical protein